MTAKMYYDNDADPTALAGQDPSGVDHGADCVEDPLRAL